MGWAFVTGNNETGNTSLFYIEVFFVLHKVKLNYFIFYGIKVRQYNIEFSIFLLSIFNDFIFVICNVNWDLCSYLYFDFVLLQLGSCIFSDLYLISLLVFFALQLSFFFLF